VIDDDPQLVDVIEEYFLGAGYEATVNPEVAGSSPVEPAIQLKQMNGAGDEPAPSSVPVRERYSVIAGAGWRGTTLRTLFALCTRSNAVRMSSSFTIL